MCTSGRETPAALGQPGLHTTARELQTCKFQGSAASNTTKIQREDPLEREERKNVAGEGKSAGPPPSSGGPTLRGPLIFLGWGPHPSGSPGFGPHLPGPTEEHTKETIFVLFRVSFLFCPRVVFVLCVFFVSCVFFLSRVFFYFVLSAFASFVPFPFFLHCLCLQCDLVSDTSGDLSICVCCLRKSFLSSP